MSSQLKKTLTPLMLWALGVGYVISGMYFGWNLGLKEGGTLGMAIATFFVILLYITFSFGYAELACSIPKAGGAFDYAHRALGRNWGFIAGLVQVIEFVFAPPAIALGIGAYLHLLIPEIPALYFAIGAYLIFTALNIYGVKAAASFEVIVTMIALAGLLLFAGVTMSHFDLKNISLNSFPHGWTGAFAALPFAIWFFLGIEGIANLAEESIHPQKDITLGFGSALLTLLFVCVSTFIFSIGVGGWEAIVFDTTGKTSDSPLPLVVEKVTGNQSVFYKTIVVVGIFGLIASFHGLLLSAGRASFEMGRVRYAPAFLGTIHPKFKTPYTALLFNMCLGILILLTGKTGEIITISVFGALMLYIISTLSLFAFRKKEPQAERPFKVPFFPYTPLVSLSLAIIALASLLIYNQLLATIFFLLIITFFILFKIFARIPSDQS